MFRFASLGVLGVAVVCSSSPALACGGGPSSGFVTAVKDDADLMLRDGRQIRLAGVEITREGEAAQAARAFLVTTLANRDVTLRAAGETPDRYGRTEAYVFVTEQGLEGSVQQVMVGRGLARVAARISDRACAAGFLTTESQARQAKRGLWAESRWAVRAAEDPAAILALRGEFAVVEGRVLSVRESGGTIYVNFGRRWTEDFTVTVAKRNERALAAAALDLKQLERRLVRVRGVIEERGGPWVEVTRPEQIELVRN
jgi:endonuclease YncB( thermonuclease family)